MADKKYYALREGNKDTNHMFRGRTPGQAALKAARRGFKDIQLRERRKKKDGMWRVHVFEGSVEKVPKPKNAPDWLSDRINKSKVKKIRVDKIKEL
ncbi:MAG: hypothetical protein A7316_02500 [Candidatus Altiarchaeales archaeon WOR_SM1_86-2]|nr:MAG: hypothetical protein A7316_02500 [Candidatus Altiarchaeales archaeon WOR_SM1_86-2]ODS40256.1 MAG: hypothetical protein A7315_09100 [Candidatus Altiarchaeales archaeon WOR_SM1_79]